jgi:photosystem II stability/assembly factor-like uncharacterized protein
VPVGASIDPDTGAFTWTPTADQVGSHSLTLRVTDNGSPTLFASERAPALHLDLTWRDGQRSAVLTDRETLTVTPAGGTRIWCRRRVAPTASANAINGSPALSDRETITITVTEANAAPVLNVVATPTLVVDEDAHRSAP